VFSHINPYSNQEMKYVCLSMDDLLSQDWEAVPLTKDEVSALISDRCEVRLVNTHGVLGDNRSVFIGLADAKEIVNSPDGEIELIRGVETIWVPCLACHNAGKQECDCVEPDVIVGG